MEENKNRVGRPLSGLNLKEGWQDEILEMYQEGAGDTEVKAFIWQQRGSFSEDLWTRWLKDEPEFSETIRFGRSLSAAWWEKQGRVNLSTQGYSYTGWYMNMKNRFGWRDKTEVDNKSTDGSMTPKRTVIKFS